MKNPDDEKALEEYADNVRITVAVGLRLLAETEDLLRLSEARRASDRGDL